MKYSILFLTVAALLSAQRIPKLPGGSSRGIPTKPGSGVGGGGKVQTELDQAQRALDQCGKYIERDKASMCTSYHAKFDDSIADAKRALTSSGVGGAAEFLTRIKEMEARKAEQVKAMGDSESKQQAVVANLSSEDAAKDKVTIEALQSFYKDFSRDIKSAPDDFKVMESWPRTQRDVDSLLKKYPAPKSRQNVPTEVHDMINKIRQLQNDHTLALAAAEQSVTKIPAMVNTAMVFAEEQIKKGVANQNYGAAVVGIGQLEDAEKRLKVYDIVAVGQKGFNPTFTSTTRDKIAALNKEAEKLAEQIIASNKPPANAYSGADAAQLRELIRKELTAAAPSLKILDIRLTSDWNRNAGYSWHNNSESWQKFDQAKLYAVAIVDGGPKFAYSRGATIYKDFINGGRTTVTVNAVKLKDGKEHPGGTYLKTNLGK